MTHKVEPATDPCWSSPDYRTARLQGLIAFYGLPTKRIVELTGHDPVTVKHWRSGRYRQIPTPVLRSLIYDLMSAQNAD